MIQRASDTGVVRDVHILVRATGVQARASNFVLPNAAVHHAGLQGNVVQPVARTLRIAQKRRLVKDGKGRSTRAE